MAVILIVDDEPLQRDILKTILSDEGYETYTAASGEEALKLAKAYEPDVVLTDLKMGKLSGIELLEKLKGLKQSPTVIIMTAFGTIDSAVDAMKKGAFDYLTKPLDKEVVLLAIRRALERTELLQRNLQLRKALNDMFSIQGIIGHSKAIKDIIYVLRKVADSTATVLILGESGTGKELIAKAIHYNSGRREKSFMAINCAAIPETLLESELFGYEPGAFTGATQRKKGLFEATNGGTIFLDEVGDLPMMTQAKDPSGPPGTGSHAHRRPRGDQGRCQDHLRHEQGPPGGDEKRPLQGRSVLSPEGCDDPDAPAEGTQGGHSRTGELFHPEVQPQFRQEASRKSMRPG